VKGCPKLSQIRCQNIISHIIYNISTNRVKLRDSDINNILGGTNNLIV
jgi:hypothetical protein